MLNTLGGSRDYRLEEVKIELTRDCTLACVHCSSNATSGSTLHLPLEVVLPLIDSAANMGVRAIVLSGGEPLLWPGLAQAVKACSDRGLHCSVYSTGISANNDEGAEELLHLGQCGLRKVVFSLYSPQEAFHERMTRRRGSFGKTVSVLESTRGSGLERELHFVPTRGNYRHLDDLMSFAAKKQVTRVSVLRLVPHGRGSLLKSSGEMLSGNGTAELRSLVLKCKAKHRTPLRVGSPYSIFAFEDSVRCTAARHTVVIGPSGNVYPCDAFKNIEPADIGVDDGFNSIHNHSLDECWRKSEYLNAVRRALAVPLGGPCQTCPDGARCGSGCLAQKVIEYGSVLDGAVLQRPDPLCLRDIGGGSHAAGR